MTGIRDTAVGIAEEVRAALTRVDEAQAEGFAQAVLDARRIVVAGVGREGLAARAFTMRLGHAGLDAHWVWDDTAPPVLDGDLLVVVSGSGRIAHLEAVATGARAAGATTAVVTAAPSGVTAQLADHLLVVPAAAYLAYTAVETVQPMGSQFEQAVLVLLDAIVLRIVEARGLAFADLAQRHRNIE